MAILGEYGQGKSTVSLIYCYNLIKKIIGGDTNSRIPILIELRGRSLRGFTKEELLAIWAYRYHIDVKSLLYLHMAGKLLIIFEGFDEIDLSGDTEIRLNHFRSLWSLNFENSKIIITGRPNFFKDRREIDLALGSVDQTNVIFLKPFNIKQIEFSLRSIESDIKDEIIQLAIKDESFMDIVSRPSLLYLVSQIWKAEKLNNISSINSGIIIDLFIKQTLRRQQLKHDDRSFMILNSSERYYFMNAIAASMGSKNLPNQISKRELINTVDTIISSIPETVSRSDGALNGQDSRPLRSNERFDWENKRNEIVDKIHNDVRSCGLLVMDSSKDGYFKFSHKSFMDFLQAKWIYESLSKRNSFRNIFSSTTKIDLDYIYKSKEAVLFFAEFLENNKDDSHEKSIMRISFGDIAPRIIMAPFIYLFSRVFLPILFFLQDRTKLFDKTGPFRLKKFIFFMTILVIPIFIFYFCIRKFTPNLPKTLHPAGNFEIFSYSNTDVFFYYLY